METADMFKMESASFPMMTCYPKVYIRCTDFIYTCSLSDDVSSSDVIIQGGWPPWKFCGTPVTSEESYSSTDLAFLVMKTFTSVVALYIPWSVFHNVLQLGLLYKLCKLQMINYIPVAEGQSYVVWRYVYDGTCPVRTRFPYEQYCR